MSIKLPQSHMMKQLLGAAAGMAAAAVVYFGMQTMSDFASNRAMLVQDNPTVSQNADRVRVNDKNIEDETLRRLQQRAKQVAALQMTATQAAGGTSTYADLGVSGGHTASDSIVASVDQQTSQPAPDDKHSGAQLDQPLPSGLANSGDGLQFIALIAILLGCVYHFRGVVRRRLVAPAMQRV